MNKKNNFVELAETHKGQGTLYCGGLDPHLFNGFEKNMEVYGPASGIYDHELYIQTAAYYQRLGDFVPNLRKEDIPKYAEVLAAVEMYTKRVVEILVTKCNVRVFKPQSGFYEQLGPMGNILLARVRNYIKELEEKLKIRIICLLDCKRGDIATTQEAYFISLIGGLDKLGIDYKPYDFDIINVTPWMGRDVMVLGTKEEPGLGLQLMQQGKGIIVVNKSSNPSGPEYQEEILQNGGITLQMKNVADLYAISQQFELEYDGLSTIGMVVGSTHICDGSIRRDFPGSTLLVPGFGAQGGKFDRIMPELIPDGKWAGLGAIFSSSRGTMFAFETKLGGSGLVKNLESDLIKSIEGFRKSEKEAYEVARIDYPFTA